MATIRKIKDKYHVEIRRKGIKISKSFHCEEDAKAFAFYKERLIDNMHNFEVNIKDTVTLDQIFDLKRDASQSLDKRSLNDIDLTLKRVKECFPNKIFYQQFTFDDWLECAKKIYKSKSFRGSKENLIEIAPKTLKRIFGVLSSVVSCAIEKGINIENHPLKVIQTFINPLIKKNNLASRID